MKFRLLNAARSAKCPGQAQFQIGPWGAAAAVLRFLLGLVEIQAAQSLVGKKR